MFSGIDLSSDTATRPTAAMKKAMMDAEVGDEQQGEDPTTKKLEERFAELLGKEAALFLPSATLANQIALLLHLNRGEELIAAENAHVFFAEGGGPAIFAGALARPMDAPSGVFSGEDVRAKFNTARGPGFPISRLVVIENTTNMGGGIAWRLSELQSVWSACEDLGLKCHLDGSRFFNATTATGQPPAILAQGFNTVTICLSKGLGAGMGAILAMGRDDWDRARRWKQCMGGSLRQSGMFAAAGLYALEHNIERLAEDHANARTLAQGLAGIEGLSVETTEPCTNMVFFRLEAPGLAPAHWQDQCKNKGFRFSRVGPNRFRAVTHLGISSSDINKVIAGAREVLRGQKS